MIDSRMPTLRDIATEAGVSAGTVSRVLRGCDQVLPQTRERVNQVAQRLRYRPNGMMRGVRNGTSQSVGVMVSVDDAFGSAIVSGVHDALCMADYAPVLLWSHWNQAEELRQIHRLMERRVDGVILRPVSHDVKDDYFREIWERGIPLVTVDTDLGWTHSDFVGTDNIWGARLAAEHLLALGHRHLAHLAGPMRALNSQMRAAGFEQAVSERPGASCVTVTCELFDHGVEEARVLMQASPRPTAIFAATDYLARDVYEVARAIGLRIPEDLSVVGYADLEFASWLSPTLTTVKQDAGEMGRCAANLLLDRVRKAIPSREPQKKNLAPSLVVRGSTAASAEPCQRQQLKTKENRT